jgi:hypothetical protein
LKSHRTRSFREQYEALPPKLREKADASYQLWKQNPNHPGLHFEKLESGDWSIRLSKSLRAVCFEDQGCWVWYFIGGHSDYDKL